MLAGGEIRAEERGIAPMVVIDVKTGDVLLGVYVVCMSAHFY